MATLAIGCSGGCVVNTRCGDGESRSSPMSTCIGRLGWSDWPPHPHPSLGERMNPPLRAGCGKTASPVRRAGCGNGSGGAVEVSAPERTGHRGGSAYPPGHSSTPLTRAMEKDTEFRNCAIGAVSKRFYAQLGEPAIPTDCVPQVTFEFYDKLNRWGLGSTRRWPVPMKGACCSKGWMTSSCKSVND